MDTGPDERETSNTWSVGLAKWMPVELAFSRTVKQRWAKRAEDFQSEIAVAAGVPETAIGDRVEESETFGDIWATATEKAARTAEGPLRDLLARLVGCALLDDAKIDEVAYMTSVAAQLEPVHVRYLERLRELQRIHEASGTVQGNILVRAVAMMLGLDVAVAQSVAERLHSLALLTDRLGGDMVNWTPDPAGAFALTPLAEILLRYVDEIVLLPPDAIANEG